jgi:hypothetical protein
MRSIGKPGQQRLMLTQTRRDGSPPISSNPITSATSESPSPKEGRVGSPKSAGTGRPRPLYESAVAAHRNRATVFGLYARPEKPDQT